MKKFLSIILVFFTMISVFAACSKSDDAASKNVSVSDAVQSTAEHNTTKISTEKADISDMQAIDIVKKISKDKLKLKEDVNHYRWLVSTSGVNVKDIDCFEVNACTIDDKDKQNPVVTTNAVYYVSFDGKKIMMKDSKTSKIVDIK